MCIVDVIRLPLVELVQNAVNTFQQFIFEWKISKKKNDFFLSVSWWGCFANSEKYLEERLLREEALKIPRSYSCYVG